VVFIHPKYALIHPKYALTHAKYGSQARIIAIAVGRCHPSTSIPVTER
jgi:hypothetical protein